MAFKSGVVRGVVLINDTLAANTNIGATSNTGTVSIGNASSTAVTILGPTNINATGAANTAIGSTSNTGTVSIGNATSTSVTVTGPTNINTSTNANTAINSTSSTGTITIGNTSSGVVTINSGTAGILVGTTANAHASTFGSTNSTSSTTVQSGSGALNITSTNGPLTINSGTGALGISTDTAATTVSFATGGAVKGVTLGSTNTTSSTVIQSGSGNVAINAGLTIDSTGRNFNTVQPAFLAYNSISDTNQTGNSALVTVQFDTELFDQGSNFASNTFTAPIAGKYLFTTMVNLSNITTATGCNIIIHTTAHDYYVTSLSLTAVKSAGNDYSGGGSVVAIMSASDTAIVQVIATGQAGNTITITGSANLLTYFSGALIC